VGSTALDLCKVQHQAAGHERLSELWAQLLVLTNIVIKQSLLFETQTSYVFIDNEVRYLGMFVEADRREERMFQPRMVCFNHKDIRISSMEYLDPETRISC